MRAEFIGQCLEEGQGKGGREWGRVNVRVFEAVPTDTVNRGQVTGRERLTFTFSS